MKGIELNANKSVTGKSYLVDKLVSNEHLEPNADEILRDDIAKFREMRKAAGDKPTHEQLEEIQNILEPITAKMELRQNRLTDKLNEFKAAEKGCIFLNYDMLRLGVTYHVKQIFTELSTKYVYGYVTEQTLRDVIRGEGAKTIILDDHRLTEGAKDYLVSQIEKGLKVMLIGGVLPLTFDSHFEKYRV